MTRTIRKHPSDDWARPIDDREAPAPTHASTEPWNANTLIVFGVAIAAMIVLGLLLY